ncbi:MAG: hypothetical protein R3C16_13230 [Hyphomonadaceae bacterium]
MSSASALLSRMATLALLALMIGSCAPGDFSYSKRLEGRYRISAVDHLRTMSVVYDRGDGGHTVLIDATVFEVGWDDRYIVAARHPEASPDQALYYYIDQTIDPSGRGNVFGPFDGAQFADETRRLSLPPMSRYAPFIYCSDRPLCSPTSDIFR